MKRHKLALLVLAALVVVGIAAGILIHWRSQPEFPPGLGPQGNNPAANVAARAELIEKIKHSHDLQWLPYGCSVYDEENKEKAQAAKMYGFHFDPPPSCHDLNPLAPVSTTHAAAPVPLQRR